MQPDRLRQSCPVREVQRDSQQCGSCPSRTADTADSQFQQQLPEKCGFSMGLVGCDSSESDPVVTCQIYRLRADCERHCTGVLESVPCYHAQHTTPTIKEKASSAARQTEAGSRGSARCEEYNETVVQRIQPTQRFSSIPFPCRKLWVFYRPGRLELVGKQSCGYLTDLATLSAQSPRLGSRPGPTLVPWCTGGSPGCPSAEIARRTRAAGRGKKVFPEK